MAKKKAVKVVVQNLFDYELLDAETRIVVQQKTGEIRGLMRKAAQDIVDIGLKLIEVKDRLPHGAFLPWLEVEFGWSDQTARRFMHVADRFGQNQQIVGFEPSALYLLAAPSTPDAARDEALELAAVGQPVTHTTAKEIVASHTTEKKSAGTKSPPATPADETPPSRRRTTESDEDDFAPEIPEQFSQDDGEPSGRQVDEQHEEQEQPEPEQPERDTDEGGREIPDVAIPAFDAVPEMRAVCRDLGKIIGEVERIGKSPAGRCMHTQSVMAHLDNAKRGLWQARPAHACPYCRGLTPKLPTCNGCAGSGWVTATTFKAAPEELRGVAS